MTIQQMYKELERLYCKTDFSDPKSVEYYMQKAKEYRMMVDGRKENDNGSI